MESAAAAVVTVLEPKSQAKTEAKTENNESYGETEEYRQPMTMFPCCRDRLFESHEGWTAEGRLGDDFNISSVHRIAVEIQ